MVRVVADDKIPFLKGALEAAAGVGYLPGGRISRRDLLHADALITRTRTECNRELLQGTPVRFIASATIGHDHIDAEYCRSAGIGWTNAPGCNASSVEQYMVSLLLWLATSRKLDFSNKTIGIVGVGNVGSKVARVAEVLGMKVLLNDPPRKRREGDRGFVELEEILAVSDIVTLHVPLNRGGEDNTFHMVDRAFISRMKKGAILVNTSRGGVAEEGSLIRGIREDRLSDVILDVFENEPEISRELLDVVTIATPHIAGYSLDGKANGTTMTVRAVSRFFGLGLEDWSPGDIPGPADRNLYADDSDGFSSEMLWELYRRTYDVTEDDRKLRDDPAAFEQLREGYPTRREPPVYAVRLFQGDIEVRHVLESLGFSVLADHCI